MAWPGLSPRAETMDPIVTRHQGPSSGPSPTHSNSNRPEFGGGCCLVAKACRKEEPSALSAAAAVSLAMTTASLDDEDESLAQFLESEVLSHVSDQVTSISLPLLLLLLNLYFSSSLKMGVCCRKTQKQRRWRIGLRRGNAWRTKGLLKLSIAAAKVPNGSRADSSARSLLSSFTTSSNSSHLR